VALPPRGGPKREKNPRVCKKPAHLVGGEAPQIYDPPLILGFKMERRPKGLMGSGEGGTRI